LPLANIRENCALTPVFSSKRDRDGDIDALAREAGPQGQLNRIIAALDFSD
jgi:hypothetical protein